MIKYNNIIKSPIITEKASFLREKFNKYSLYVFVNVNKCQIKSAIESLFNVKVSSINVIKVKPKYRRFRGVIGCEKQKKKVYFSLIDGQKLDIMSV
ncbi:ribosomal protein L23 [Wolbachia endosymbiont of Armadillidium vulgare str. wVulC]|uniref:Large ribosomal subunit protein uL23 n=1 Tax=Wolbachia endosymbiont of Armadillidium arcangelii TaxID=3158571 RepID=A0AAU7Q2J3_9RICK|nr:MULTISPECIES: 50S ribosomal protein L23 [unclassified Wolbachia]OJH30356.1 50S ribosomal protein L23 [Armadillidium vulgare] [Wolbachia endosymbiont of Armadillidium vulgare]KLT23240.1 ribosomal protein L23 [Wolbachia endosymbiont of Armadillidium vulgare str. wVulC]OJH30825.1 50S ribosomal protein L23 [Wolbachia endosymbiont of Armadillidium vulgare]OJH31840.1 50S ribosomal protein L23 [Wolbachia endosymbiont of Armadillidium vulgare]RDD35437.1 50S ribosomal protein L23 [Wolbachia endosymb